MDPGPQARAYRPPHLLHTTVRGRDVIFDPKRRELFVLARDAAAVWLLLEESLSFDELSAAFADRLGRSNTAKVDSLGSLLGPLLDAGLVRLEEPDAARNRA